MRGPDPHHPEHRQAGQPAPMLWTYIGDIDNGERCIQKKETGR
ncbi:hypothetical protein [Streptomyces sp. RKAG293]|nr:hypothetical protein [Streptomyces sp. RKAG293]